MVTFGQFLCFIHVGPVEAKRGLKELEGVEEPNSTIECNRGLGKLAKAWASIKLPLLHLSLFVYITFS